MASPSAGLARAVLPEAAVEPAAEPRGVRLAGRRCSIEPIGSFAGFATFRVDLPLGMPLPEYAARRSLHRRLLLRLRARTLSVLRDRVRGVELWQWCDPETGLYRERLCAAGDDSPVPPAAVLEALHEARFEEEFQPRLLEAVSSAVVSAVLRRIRARHGAAFRAGGALERSASWRRSRHRLLREAIETSGEPGLLRAAWRALTALTVLDPAAGTGDRLVAATRLLTPLYETCLERMAVCVADLERSRERHRPERLADFRRLLARAGERGRYSSVREFVLRALVPRNLFGVVATPEALVACRERLRRAGLAAGLARLHHGDASRGIGSLAEARWLADERIVAADAVERIEEQLRALDRASALLLRLGTPSEASGPEPDEPAVAARLAELRSEVDGWCAGRGGRDAPGPGPPRGWPSPAPPLHAWLEFHEVLDAGGFDVVLGRSARRSSPFRSRVLRERGAPLAAAPPAPLTPTPFAMDAPRLELVPEHPRYPEKLWQRLEPAAPPPLVMLGNPRLLELPLLALFSSVRVPGSLVLRTLDLARELRDAGVPVAGGFQAPLERECRDILLRGGQPLVISPARSLDGMRLPAAWRAALAASRLLLVSRFAGGRRRPTTQMAEARNALVAGFAERVLVTHATPGGRTYSLARALLAAGRTVYTLDDPRNLDLKRLGAVPIDAAAEVAPS